MQKKKADLREGNHSEKFQRKFFFLLANKMTYNIEANIYCVRESHKGIIIGKGGEMLKKISTYARHDLEKMFDCKVNLRTWVKVKEDWINSDSVVNQRFKLK